MPQATSPPFLTISASSGTGGKIKLSPEDFLVDEIPSYLPSGEGDHVFVRLRKRGIPTFEAVKRIARALDINPSGIGTAGLKDAQAITTQQISLPPPITPQQANALEIEGLEILSATRHPHKLRTGHLKANRFVIAVRDCIVDENEAATRAEKTLDVLASCPGAPNWFGKQRFGSAGDNAERGRELLRGTFRGRKPRPRVLRLLLSSIQSLLFNDYLLTRISEDNYRQVIEGDILKKTDSGGIFETEDLVSDASRFDDGAVVATGPMFGPKMRRPSLESAAAGLEDSILAKHELSIESFARYAKLAPGTRRPLSVVLTQVAVKPIEARTIEVSFTLPSGSYATSILREILKPTP